MANSSEQGRPPEGEAADVTVAGAGDGAWARYEVPADDAASVAPAGGGHCTARPSVAFPERGAGGPVFAEGARDPFEVDERKLAEMAFGRENVRCCATATTDAVAGASAFRPMTRGQGTAETPLDCLARGEVGRAARLAVQRAGDVGVPADAGCGPERLIGYVGRPTVDACADSGPGRTAAQTGSGPVRVVDVSALDPDSAARIAAAERRGRAIHDEFAGVAARTFGKPRAAGVGDQDPDAQAPTGAVRSADADHLDFVSLPVLGLIGVARTAAEGAEKYGAFNYLKGLPARGCINHALRHLYLYVAGDRSEPHLEHAAWNCMAAAQAEVLQPEASAADLPGPGLTLTPAMLVRLDTEEKAKAERRRKGLLKLAGSWLLARVPEVARILGQRKKPACTCAAYRSATGLEAACSNCHPPRPACDVPAAGELGL